MAVGSVPVITEMIHYKHSTWKYELASLDSRLHHFALLRKQRLKIVNKELTAFCGNTGC